MDLSTFIIAIFCLVDDRLKDRRIRQRGPSSKLSDSEVLTIEIVGEFLGLDTDKGIHLFFRRHYGEWFPALQREHCNSRGRIVISLRNLSVVHDCAEHSGPNGLQAAHGPQDGALTDIPCVQDE